MGGKAMRKMKRFAKMGIFKNLNLCKKSQINVNLAACLCPLQWGRMPTTQKNLHICSNLKSPCYSLKYNNTMLGRNVVCVYPSFCRNHRLGIINFTSILILSKKFDGFPNSDRFSGMPVSQCGLEKKVAMVSKG